MRKMFTEHPHSLGESYAQHAVFAFKFGINLLYAGFACFIHAIFPFIFQKTASNLLLQMMHKFLRRMPSLADRQRLLASLSESDHRQ